MMNLMQIAQSLRTASNPAEALSQMAMRQGDPILTKAVEMIKGKNPSEYMGIAQNLAQSKGQDINMVQQQILQQIGLL